MAYEDTAVPVSRSQDRIKILIYQHKGTGVVFVSQPPKEGFEGMVELAGKPYHIRVMATCKAIPTHNKAAVRLTENQRAAMTQNEEKRVWRVLFHHLKALFEAVDSGVVTIEQVILPYIVLHDNRTLAEHVVPHIDELLHGNPMRLLGTPMSHLKE